MDSHFRDALRAIDYATKGLTDEQWKARVKGREGKWCAAEILEHLSLAFGTSAKVFEKCLEKGKMLGNPPSFKHRMMAFVVADMGYFPPGRKAPEFVVPTGKVEGEEVLKLARANLLAMGEAHKTCVERFGSDGRLADHPVLGPLTPDQWAKFHLVHTTHHMKQIHAIRETMLK